MPVKTQIIGDKDNRKTEVLYKEECDCNTLAVSTINRLNFNNKLKVFTNSIYGAEMAQDASPPGSGETKVHNGGDDVLSYTRDHDNGVVSVSKDLS
jgi:hypothetical protein